MPIHSAGTNAGGAVGATNRGAGAGERSRLPGAGAGRRLSLNYHLVGAREPENGDEEKGLRSLPPCTATSWTLTLTVYVCTFVSMHRNSCQNCRVSRLAIPAESSPSERHKKIFLWCVFCPPEEDQFAARSHALGLLPT